MRPSDFVCPECGASAVGTLENTRVVSHFDKDAETLDWEGTTDVLWEHTDIVTSDRLPVLVCGNWHDFTSPLFTMADYENIQ